MHECEKTSFQWFFSIMRSWIMTYLLRCCVPSSYFLTLSHFPHLIVKFKGVLLSLPKWHVQKYRLVCLPFSDVWFPWSQNRDACYITKRKLPMSILNYTLYWSSCWGKTLIEFDTHSLLTLEGFGESFAKRIPKIFNNAKVGSYFWGFDKF